MATPTVAPATRSFPFESIAKTGTLALPLIYVLGFMIVTFHQASFGVAEFGFVRVKILAAGLVFAVFVAIPGLAGIRSFRLLGMRMPGGTRVDLRDDSQKVYLYMIKVADSYPVSFFLSLVFAPFFVPHLTTWLTTVPTYEQPGRWLDIAIAMESFCIFTLTVLPIPYIAKQIAHKPKRCTV